MRIIMCGRYLYSLTNKELKEIADSAEKNLYDNYKTGEIFPTNICPIYIEDDKEIKSVLGRWGLPKWDGKGVIINTRSESMNIKPMYKKMKRCIVPAAAFYEWKRNNKKDKYIFNKPDDILYMAGLYDIYENNQINLFNPQAELNYTIITKDANESVKDIHSRMPVIFSKTEMKEWLDGESTDNLLSKNDVHLNHQLVFK